MPESHQVRAVAEPGQPLREDGGGGGEADRSEGTDVTPLYSQPVGVEASQQGCSGGRTPRLGVETLQADSFAPERLQVWGDHHGIVPGDVIVTNVVTNQQQEVWSPPLLLLHLDGDTETSCYG